MKLIRKKGSHEKRALKIIKKDKTSRNSLIANEIKALKDLDHPNILKIYSFYETMDEYQIVTEFCTGTTLFEHIIEKQKRLPEE